MVFVSNAIRHDTTRYIILHNFLVPEQGILLGFPLQKGVVIKFKTLVAHTHLIKVEFPPGPQRRIRCLQNKGEERSVAFKTMLFEQDIQIMSKLVVSKVATQCTNMKFTYIQNLYYLRNGKNLRIISYK